MLYVPQKQFVQTWGISETNTDKVYLQDYVTCNKTGISSKEAFTEGKTEKLLNYFC